MSSNKYSRLTSRPGNTVYVSKAERRRVLMSLKENLETKTKKSNNCKVTKELTVVLMKLANLKENFTEMEQKENKKHSALAKMMDIVRDDICSLLKKETVSSAEISIVVNRTQELELLLCTLQNKLNEGTVNIEVGSDDKSDKLLREETKKPPKAEKPLDDLQHSGDHLFPAHRKHIPANEPHVVHGPLVDSKPHEQPHENKPLEDHKSHKHHEDHQETHEPPVHHKPLLHDKPISNEELEDSKNKLHGPQKERDHSEERKLLDSDEEAVGTTPPKAQQDVDFEKPARRFHSMKRFSYPEDKKNKSLRERRTIDRSSYPYGFRDINVRKDKKSFEKLKTRETFHMVTTSIANSDECQIKNVVESKNKARKERRNKSVLTPTPLRSERIGTESSTQLQNHVKNAKRRYRIIDFSPSSKTDVQLFKSSCIFNKLRKNKGITNNLSDRNDSFEYEKERDVTENVFNCEFQHMHPLISDSKVSNPKVHKATSYDDFILDPKFSWNNPCVEGLSRKTFVIDSKSWRYRESDYLSRMTPKKTMKHRKQFKNQSTNTPKFFNKRDNFTQTEVAFSASIQHVYFFRVFYTNSHFAIFQSVNKNLLKFPKGPSIIDKSTSDNGFTYVTCRADPEKELAHFTLIKSGGEGDSIPQEPVLKLQKVQKMWIQQTKEFYDRLKQKGDPENSQSSLVKNPGNDKLQNVACLLKPNDEISISNSDFSADSGINTGKEAFSKAK